MINGRYFLVGAGHQAMGIRAMWQTQHAKIGVFPTWFLNQPIGNRLIVGIHEQSKNVGQYESTRAFQW